MLGRVDDAEKQRVLESADVLCAPSLGGESFGMVLTEGFAAGTPVVASDIAGYRDVVRDGVDGVLVPRGDATALAETLRDLWLAPSAARAMARAAAEQRASASPGRTSRARCSSAYEDAIAHAGAAGRRRSARAVRIGAAPGRPAAARAPAAPAEPRAAAARGRAQAGARARAPRRACSRSRRSRSSARVLAFRRIGVHEIALALLDSSPVVGARRPGVMCVSMAVRAVAWHAILTAALPARARAPARRDAGHLHRRADVARRCRRASASPRARWSSRGALGRPRERLPVVLGTIVSQTLLNILALVAARHRDVLDGRAVPRPPRRADLRRDRCRCCCSSLVLLAPALLQRGRHRARDAARAGGQARHALARVRAGLAVFRHPRLGAQAVVAQLRAWALQWLACYVLLLALGLDDRAGLGAAAAVLFAVNVTAVLPATPSNLGIFQAACVAVLSGGYGVSQADALGYGIVLQAVEIATAVIMGMPALVKEGLSWKDVRLRALQTAPVELRHPRGRRRSRPARRRRRDAPPAVREPRSGALRPSCAGHLLEVAHLAARALSSRVRGHDAELVDDRVARAIRPLELGARAQAVELPRAPHTSMKPASPPPCGSSRNGSKPSIRPSLLRLPQNSSVSWKTSAASSSRPRTTSPQPMKQGVVRHRDLLVGRRAGRMPSAEVRAQSTPAASGARSTSSASTAPSRRVLVEQASGRGRSRR